MEKLSTMIEFINDFRIIYKGGFVIIDLLIWGWFIYCIILMLLGYKFITKE